MALRGYRSQFKHGLSPELQKERHEAYVREKLRRDKNRLEKAFKIKTEALNKQKPKE